jgi:hypothetical protein
VRDPRLEPRRLVAQQRIDPREHLPVAAPRGERGGARLLGVERCDRLQLVGALRPSFDDLGDQLGVARDLEELLLHVALVGREELPEALARALLLAYQVGKHVRLGHGLERVARGRLVVEGQRLDRGLVGLVEGADRGGWRGRGGEKECGQCECGGAHDSTLRLERLRAI